jgi:hypothetical protein
LDRSAKLSADVDGWYQLSYLTASIAESAQDWDEAGRQYDRVREVVSTDSKQSQLLKLIDNKIRDIKERIQKQQATVSSAAIGPEADTARQQMQMYAAEAVGYLNELLGQRLKVPVVKIQTDVNLRFSPYYDWTNIVAAPEVQYLPDFCFRNAMWPHLAKIVGVEAMSKDDAQTDILYSYADVFTMLAQQHHLKQNEKTSNWLLGQGYIEWLNGNVVEKPYAGTPWESFKAPGTAYPKGPTGSKDWQVAHMRDFVTSTADPSRRYINSGILNKAFYLVATEKGTQRAAEVWIAALRQFKRAKPADFQQFGRLLYEQAGPDKDAVRDALEQVGIDPLKSREASS